MRIAVWAMILGAATLSAAPDNPPAKRRVAVFDFDFAAAPGGATQNAAPNLGKAVADLLVARLVQDGAFSVIERSAIDKLLAEQNLTNSDRTDPIAAAKLGRILGVDAIVLGAITRYEFEDKVTGGGNPFTDLAHGSLSNKHEITAYVGISARLVSPDTAEVLGVGEGIGEVDHKGVRVDVRDRKRIAGSSPVNNPILDDARDQAIAHLAAQLGQNAPKVPARIPVVEGLVADANESGRLILNVGSRNGIKAGDRLQVWRAGKEIRDPATGAVLMHDDILLGDAIVATVNETSSIATYRGTEPVKTGDLVKSLPRPQ